MAKKAFNFTTIFRNSTYLRNLKSQTPKYTSSAQLKPIRNSPLVNYQLRKMKEADIPEIIQRRGEIGALDCESCLRTWIQLDPKGIHVAVHESGEILGAISSVIYPEDFSFFGMFFVLHEYRGCGIGAKLFNMAVEYVVPRNGGLYSVPNKINLYKELNFPVLVEDFTCTKNISAKSINTKVLSKELPASVRIEPFQDSLLDAICSYDLTVIGYKRNLLLELSCNEQNSKTFVAMKDGVCVGFGTIKLTCLGYGRVGPLYADDYRIAEVLLKSLVESFPQGNGFAMITLSNNILASKLTKKLNVPITQHLPQMYIKKKVNADTNKIFAIFDINGSPF